jgi:hypothetical protein
MVIATQNPVDMDGTYPLPEAQLDRFLMRISMGYPDHRSEVAMLAGVPSGVALERMAAVATREDVARMVEHAERLHVATSLYDYVVALVAATREHPELRLGASPRAGLALLRAARVRAAAEVRAFLVPEDITALAVPVIAHRLIVTPEAELRGRTGADVVADVLASVPTPQEGPAEQYESPPYSGQSDHPGQPSHATQALRGVSADTAGVGDRGRVGADVGGGLVAGLSGAGHAGCRRTAGGDIRAAVDAAEPETEP